MKGILYPQELIDNILEQIKTSGKTISEICSEKQYLSKRILSWSLPSPVCFSLVD